MLILSNIEILEHWFKMNSLDSHGLSVLSKDWINGIAFSLSHLKVLSSSKGSVFNSNWENWSLWIFLDSVGSESTVDAVAEGLVVNQEFWVISSIFGSHLIKFFFSEVEVEHGENTFKLSLGDLSSSKFIKIEEKFFNSYSFHDNLGSKSILNIWWTIGSFNSLFQKSVIDNSKSTANFTEAEKVTMINMLEAIRIEIKNRRILIKPQFQDYDRTNCQHITCEQFRRVLKELRLIPPSEELFQLILRKYLDKGNVREINYRDFCADIDQPKDMFV